MAWGRAVNTQDTQTAGKVRASLEEELELSTVTELRQNLLPAIDRIEKNPSLRFLILKHGKPQAVLMSAQTYELVKTMMNQVASQLAAIPREQAVEDSFQRFRSERGHAAAQAAVASGLAAQNVSSQLDSVIEALKQVREEIASTNSASANQAIAE